MPGRTPKPTKAKILQGTFRKDRANANEPQPSGPLGNPPSSLNKAQRKAWKEIVANCCPGVLTSADRIAVEVAAVLLAEFRENPADFLAARLTRLSSLLGKFGMTPADRTRINVQPSNAEPNPWDDL